MISLSLLNCRGWTWIWDLPTSTSQNTEITGICYHAGVYHHAWLQIKQFLQEFLISGKFFSVHQIRRSHVIGHIIDDDIYFYLIIVLPARFLYCGGTFFFAVNKRVTRMTMIRKFEIHVHWLNKSFFLYTKKKLAKFFI